MTSNDQLTLIHGQVQIVFIPWKLGAQKKYWVEKGKKFSELVHGWLEIWSWPSRQFQGQADFLNGYPYLWHWTWKETDILNLDMALTFLKMSPLMLRSIQGQIQVSASFTVG